MPEEPSSAIMPLPERYDEILKRLLESDGAESRPLIVSALNFVNENGSNASELVTFDDQHFDGSEFTMVETGSDEIPGLVDLFGEKLVKRRP